MAKLLLPSVSQTIITSFRCEEYDDGQFVYLLADHEVDCKSKEYTLIQVRYV